MTNATSAAPAPVEPRWQARDLAYLILIQLVWGGNWIPSKLAVLEMPPLMLMAVRFAILALVFLPFMRWHPREMGIILATALANGALQFGLLFWGIALAGDIAPLAVVMQLGTPFVTVLSVIFLGDRLGYWRMGALALAFGGSALVGFDPRVIEYGEAVLLCTSASLVWSIGAILMRRLTTVGVFDMQGWIAWLAWPPLLAASLLIETDPAARMAGASLQAWLSLAYLLIGASIVGHAGFNYLLKRYPVPKMAPFLPIAPLSASVLGVLWFGDEITWRIALGGAMTLVGVLIITVREGRRRAKA
jgi:O-acetylserine/cysteine efflux transporter